MKNHVKLPVSYYFILFFALFLLGINSCSTDENPDTTSNPNEEIDQSPIFIDGEDVNLTETLIIDKDRKFVTNILSQEIYQQYVNKEADVRDITKSIYTHFEDDYDLIVILAVESEQPAGVPFGFNTSSKNEIQGLGGTIFDSTGSFGSDGKLNGVIFMPRTEYIRTGPFLHEIAHLWGNKGFIPTTVSGHWGYSSAAGQLGGFDTLTNLGGNNYKATVAGRTSFGSFANGGNSIPYSNLELYLMGLIGEEELEPIQVAVNPVAGANAGEFTADEITTFSVEELIAINGARVPSVENSQKEFSVLTVIVAPEALTDDKKENINAYIDEFFAKEVPTSSTYNFWTATGQRGSMVNTITEASIIQ